MELPFGIDLTQPHIRNLLLTVAALVGMYVLVRLSQRAVLKFIEQPERRYRTSKFIGRVGILLSLLLIVLIWSPQPRGLVTILSLIGAGLAISMREALLSIAGRINIALRPPYVQGDRIEINSIKGDVIDIRLIHTSLMEVGGWVNADQSTGRIVHIPNSWILQFGCFNYTQGFSFVWNELPVTISRDSDWEEAREIMLSFAQESAAIVEQQAARQIRRMSREFLVHYSILTPFVYVEIVPNGIRLTLRYLCEVRKRRGTEHALHVSLLKAFAANERIELVSSVPTGEAARPLPAKEGLKGAVPGM